MRHSYYMTHCKTLSMVTVLFILFFTWDTWSQEREGPLFSKLACFLKYSEKTRLENTLCIMNRMMFTVLNHTVVTKSYLIFLIMYGKKNQYNYQPLSQGDNALGSVCPSVHLCALSQSLISVRKQRIARMWSIPVMGTINSPH